MKKKLGITLAVVVLLVCVISVACFAACDPDKEGPQGPVEPNKDNAQTATETNWAEIDSKSAETTITITDAEIALGVDGDNKAVSIKASARIDLVRTWKDGVLTIDITAKPTAISPSIIAGGADFTGTVTSFLENMGVNFSQLTELEFKGQAFYKYGSAEKTIGIRNMTVSGLASALPVVVESNPNANITDEPFAIQFRGESGWVSEVSYDLSNIDLANDPTFGAIIKNIFNEGYSLDLVAIIESLLLNQTLLDFSDATNAQYVDGTYSNTVQFTDNLSFISDVWDNVKNKASIGDLLSSAKLPIGDDGVSVVELLKAILGTDTLDDLLGDLFGLISGDMSVSGTITDGIFSKLSASIPGARLSLSDSQVADVVETLVKPLLGTLSIPANIQGVIDTLLPFITEGSAYISFGNIQVNSTYTVA